MIDQSALDQSPPAITSLTASSWHHAGMAEPSKQPKLRMVCGTCGSEDVSRDAWGDWDVEAQDWVLRTVFDYAHCHACDCETRIEERPM